MIENDGRSWSRIWCHCRPSRRWSWCGRCRRSSRLERSRKRRRHRRHRPASLRPWRPCRTVDHICCSSLGDRPSADDLALLDMWRGIDNLEQLVHNLLAYFEDPNHHLPQPKQTPQSVVSLCESLRSRFGQVSGRPNGLTKAERLQICDLAPTELVEIYLVRVSHYILCISHSSLLNREPLSYRRSLSLRAGPPRSSKNVTPDSRKTRSKKLSR